MSVPFPFQNLCPQLLPLFFPKLIRDVRLYVHWRLKPDYKSLSLRQEKTQGGGSFTGLSKRID